MADVVGFLKKAFPFISAAASFGGPLGTLAASAVGNALGVDKKLASTPEAIAAAVAGATPEQIAALKKAEQDFQLQMAQLGYQDAEELEKIAANDRASARQREISLKDKIPAMLAMAITLGFFGLLVCMMKYAPPASNKDLLNIMLGSLGTAWIGVTSYYFGSSAGSARKTELLANGNK